MTASGKEKIRILQVVGRMYHAGTETWLMHVLRNIDRELFHIDFLVHTTDPGPYDSEIHALGAKIIPCLHPSKPHIYARNLRHILHKHGPYDIVHSHLHHFSGLVLWLASTSGVPIRIAHSHNDTSAIDAEAHTLRGLYLRLASAAIVRFATHGLAASEPAARALFGPNWKSDPRWRVLHCSIDLEPFRNTHNSGAVRAELGIPPDAFVLGHAGRFQEQKNHSFLIDIICEAAQRDPSVWGLLVGDGPLRPTIERKTSKAGIGSRVVFTGVRSDVPRLMLEAMDVFIFPSLYEGLGLVLIEAQAAGIPCVISDVVPAEADIVGPLVCRLSLSQHAGAWAEAALAVRNVRRTLSRDEARMMVEESDFNIRAAIRQLTELYSLALPRKDGRAVLLQEVRR